MQGVVVPEFPYRGRLRGASPPPSPEILGRDWKRKRLHLLRAFVWLRCAGGVCDGDPSGR